jgi:hypothetical protein
MGLWEWKAKKESKAVANNEPTSSSGGRSPKHTLARVARVCSSVAKRLSFTHSSPPKPSINQVADGSGLTKELEPHKSHVVVTGGAGYIGSHTIIELQTAGYNVVVIDSLSNSSLEPLRRVQKITGKQVEFHKVDIRDVVELNKVFAQYDKISCVIHFAALKSIGESWEKPALYYATNVVGTLNVIESMKAHKDCNNLIISSSGIYSYFNPSLCLWKRHTSSR